MIGPIATQYQIFKKMGIELNILGNYWESKHAEAETDTVEGI
jgi:hypothetical protein